MFQSMHMRQQPRLHLLVASDLRPGVRTGAERGDEQRRLPYLAGVTVADRQGRAGPVHEGFLAGLVLLAQHHVEFLAPTLIELAESADMCCNTCQPLCGGGFYVARSFESHDSARHR